MGKKRRGNIRLGGGSHSVRPEENEGQQHKIDAEPPSSGELKSATAELTSDTGKGEMTHGHSSGHKQIVSDPQYPNISRSSSKLTLKHGIPGQCDESSSATIVSLSPQDAIVSSGGQEPPNPGDVPAAGDTYKQSGCTYVFYLILYILLGSTFYYLSQLNSKGTEFSGGSISFTDGLYLSAQTITTVGYGDVLPATTLSKTFIVCYVSAGLFLIAIVYEIASEVMDRFELWVIQKFHTKNRMIDGTIFNERKLVIRIIVSLTYLLMSIAGCAVALHHWENFEPYQAVYVSVVSVTTLGYGDLSFRSTRGRVFFSFWILVSYMFVFRIVALVTALTQSRRRTPAFWINPLKRLGRALARWITGKNN